MVALLFFIGILTPIILSAPDSFLTRHRSILPTVSTKRSTPQKWIVHLWPNCSHHHFATRLADHHRLAVSPPKITHEYHHVLHGLTVQDVEESALKLLPCIKFYEKDSVKRLVSVPSWGIDRLDQKDLPLDNSYQSTYSGANVDVYILDTGLDTNHIEFSTSGSSRVREVKNIYNAFVTNRYAPSADTDGHGHGTHVAGTIGGNTVGVARGVNIYSLKILSNDGEGETSDIILALELVHTKGSASNRRSIMSMSLGGSCDGDCEDDSLVLAVENLYEAGILSSVAAGNSGCNGCVGSPNSAPHAVNVGATNIDDDVTYFSNYGPCVDIFAPGYNIISASPKTISRSESQYVEMSGTSMACPHVTGVLALNMEKYPSASLEEIVKSLICDAAQSLLNINPYDTTSRNLLLQIPRTGINGLEACPHSFSCPNNCSGVGICLPARVLELPSEILSPYEQIPIALNSTQCFCEAGYEGSACEIATTETCDRSSHRVTIDLYDSFGDGWSFGRFLITNFEGKTVNGATDSLCEGTQDYRTYCLAEGTYVFSVDKGMFPQENQWSMCGVNGGGQYTGVFSVDAKSHGSFFCKFICDGGNRPLDSILLMSEGDGWAGAFYSVYSQSGVMLYGGTLLEGSAGAHHVCFPKTECSIMLIRLDGESPGDISYEVCGYTAYADEILKICVDDLGRCTAEPQTPEQPSNCPSAAHPSNTNHLPISLMNFGLKKYSESVTSHSLTLQISDATSNELIFSSNLTNTFVDTFDVCLTDGCYSLEVDGVVSPPLSEYEPSGLWVLCGYKGTLPFHASSFCVEHNYQFCYGLSGCPVVVSHAHTSEQQYFVIYGKDENGEGNLVDMIADVGPLHGAYDLCDISDGEYEGFFGFGKEYLHNEVTICQQTIQIPTAAHVHVSGNGTSCHLSNIIPRTCTATQFPHDLLKVDEYGDGWGKKVTYSIHEASGSKSQVYHGKMTNGQVAVDHLCFEKNTCYTFSLTTTDQDFVDEILWVLCGYVGEAPIQSLEFCVEEDSCRFTSISDGSYNQEEDDDFPFISPEPSSVPTAFHTGEPSSTPSLRPIQSPQTSAPTSPSLSPTISPSVSPSVVSTATFTDAPSISPSTETQSSLPPTTSPSLTPTIVPSIAPSIQDDDTVYDQPYQAVDSVYLMTLEVNVSFIFTLDSTTGRLSLLPSDFQFLEFALRSNLEVNSFVIWNSSATAPHLVSSKQHENAFFGHLIFSFLVRVSSEDFDFFSLKQSLLISLQTDFLDGFLQKIVSVSLTHQIDVSDEQYPLRTFLLTTLTVLPGTAEILSFSSSHPAPYPSLFVGVNVTGLLPPPDEATGEGSSSSDPSSDYWDSHAWFALTVSGFTLAALLLCYLFFLLLRCRVKTMNDSNLLPNRATSSSSPSLAKVSRGGARSQRRKGYAKVNIGQNDSNHNEDELEYEEEGEGTGTSGDGRGGEHPGSIAKRVGKKLMKGMKEGLRGKRRHHRDVEDGSGFVELDNLDSEDEVTLDLNEMLEARHQPKQSPGGGDCEGDEETQTY